MMFEVAVRPGRVCTSDLRGFIRLHPHARQVLVYGSPLGAGMPFFGTLELVPVQLARATQVLLRCPLCGASCRRLNIEFGGSAGCGRCVRVLTPRQRGRTRRDWRRHGGELVDRVIRLLTAPKARSERVPRSVEALAEELSQVDASLVRGLCTHGRDLVTALDYHHAQALAARRSGVAK